MAFTIVIPARYASTRLPGKPLLDLCGKPLIQHVYERALQCGADSVVIATDDPRIQEVAQRFGADVCMTSTQHHTGTDRLAEVAVLRKFADDTIVVNLQGDEPLMPASLLRQVAGALAEHRDAALATLCTPIHDAGQLFDPHVVKVVLDHAGYAMYFSRAPIPWDRQTFAISPRELSETTTHYRHLGVYAYRAGFLKEFANWPVTPLEKAESLEQLRVLWHGKRIHVSQAVEAVPAGVDTEEDLRRLRRELEPGVG